MLRYLCLDGDGLLVVVNGIGFLVFLTMNVPFLSGLARDYYIHYTLH